LSPVRKVYAELKNEKRRKYKQGLIKAAYKQIGEQETLETAQLLQHNNLKAAKVAQHMLSATNR